MTVIRSDDYGLVWHHQVWQCSLYPLRKSDSLTIIISRLRLKLPGPVYLHTELNVGEFFFGGFCDTLRQFNTSGSLLRSAFLTRATHLLRR